jgi:hypothetical protein
MYLRFALCALLGLAIAGCAADAPYSGKDATSSIAGSGEYEEAPSSPATSGAPLPRSIPRKIIYTAEVTLTVERLPTAEKDLLALVKRHQGYVASTDVSGTSGVSRTGTWKLRVPVTTFEVFRKELEQLGELQRMHVDSQDVTEEYYDVQARIGNKQQEEKRLLEHLRSSTGSLADILAVEKELSRVRGEIEQLQGRLKLLANQTELTTITVNLNEVEQFIPSRGTSFGAELGRTFNGSLRMMQDAARGVALLAVGLAPWAFVALLIATPIVLVVKKSKRR